MFCRELGVHISRIQSLTLDNLGTSQLLLARVMGNNAFNEIMEATLGNFNRPTQASNMDERSEYIRAKYMDKKFVLRTCSTMLDILQVIELLQRKLIIRVQSPMCNNSQLRILFSIRTRSKQSKRGRYTSYCRHVWKALITRYRYQDIKAQATQPCTWQSVR